MTEQKRIIQCHGMTNAEVREFHRVFKENSDIIIKGPYEITVEKKESIDVVHVWKRKYL